MPKFHLAPGTKRWLEGMEEGSFEDSGHDPSHVYAILTQPPSARGVSRWEAYHRFEWIQIDTTEEARTVLRSVEYFAEDSGFETWRPAFGRCLTKLAHQIRAHFPDA